VTEKTSQINAAAGSETLLRIYGRLLRHFGPRHWWPGESSFEVCVGAVLTQNTNWKNVERAIANLKDAGVLKLSVMHLMEHHELAELIRPAGYFRLKARRLKALLDYLYEVGGKKLEGFNSRPTDKIRKELLDVWGVGPETADSILLYALGRPVFVVDAYTKRIFYRLGLTPKDMEYEDMRAYFESNLPDKLKLFNDYHAQIVATGNNFCSPKPKCDGCPLEDICEKRL